MTTALAQLGAVRDSDLAQSSPAGAALNNMLVKVLVRRAAAHSQLLDLPAAASDLTQVRTVPVSMLGAYVRIASHSLLGNLCNATRRLYVASYMTRSWFGLLCARCKMLVLTELPVSLLL